jgi:DNA invertase Pin-like site-specific DNA recombinase
LKAAIYSRVSTAGQTVDNQVRELEELAAHRGWQIVARYCDAGISGAKTREQRPGLDKMLTEAGKHKFDVVMTWAVDRLGRSTVDLINTMQTLRGAKVDLYVHQSNLDTTTPAGRALFQMLGVFAEFEREMISERVKAGMSRMKYQGRRPGPRTLAESNPEKLKEVQDMLRSGKSQYFVQKNAGVAAGTVLKVKRAIEAEKLSPKGELHGECV